MQHQLKTRHVFVGFGLVLVILSLACNLTGSAGETKEVIIPPTNTPTPTHNGDGVITPTVSESRCAGLSGTVELQVLVGPADAVGLEPVAIGDIPFAVISQDGEYIIQGNDSISYEDVLTQEWGTYTVSFAMDVDLGGDCTGEKGNEKLNMTVDVSGEQMVEVDAEGFQGEYPWSGSHHFNLKFPLEDGAAQEGEGWTLVLHLNN